MRITILLLFILILGCNTNSDNGMITGPDPGDNGNGNGNEVPVSFANDVLPIFVASCSGSGCHNPGAQSGVRLGSWAQVTGSVGQQYGGPVIIAGNAAGSPLVDKIGSSPGFGQRMPLGGAGLSSGEIQAIVAWIDEGAANN